MKKLLFFLLIIPSIGNSQVKSFDDLKQINSAQQFKRVVIENGYEKNPRNDNVEIFLSYGIDLKKQTNGYYGSSYFGEYFIGDDNIFGIKKDEWNFQFSDLSYYRKNGICYYDIIVDEIKNQCKFYKVDEDKYGRDIVLYSCAGSTYKGKIGFFTNENTGFIKHLID